MILLTISALLITAAFVALALAVDLLAGRGRFSNQ